MARLCCTSDQEVLLFSTTVRENVLIGTNRDKVSEQQLLDALTAAAFNKDLERLPKGLDAHIGPKGQNLSRGQRQRIALARTFVRNRPYMFFDEPTSSQDKLCAKVIFDSLVRLSRDSAVFVITHELTNLDQVSEKEESMHTCA